MQTNKTLAPKAELFNIDQDLAEKNNLATKHPDKVAALTKLMNDSRTSSVHPNFKLKSERK